MLLQMSLACKIMVPDKTVIHDNDSEDTMSLGTPTKELKCNLNDVNNLSLEFDQRRVVFDEDVKCHVDVKLEPDSISIKNQHAGEELSTLKLRFEKWKKDYKARLRGTKARLRLNGEKGCHRKWWCKKTC